MDQQPKRRMVLRKIGTGAEVKAAAPSLPPVRPPMPSRPAVVHDDNQLAPLPPRSNRAPVPIRKRAAADVAGWGPGPNREASTLRPPAPPDSTPDSDPIPLTRLHPSRGRYQSAIDMEAYAPADLDEGRNRDSSSSTTLPPLVASLVPPAASLYVSRDAGRSGMTRMLVVGGGIALLALFAIIGGVAVGQHVAHTNDTAAHVPVVTQPVAAASPPPASPTAVEARQAGNAAAEQVAPAATPAAVDSLPRAAMPAAAVGAAAPSPAPAVDRKPVVAAAAVAPRVVQASVAPVAPAAAAPAAAPSPASDPAGDSPKAAPSPATGTRDSQDVAKAADESKSASASAEKAPAAATPAAPAAPDNAEDPLMKAMRQSLAEEQERAKQR